MSTHAAKKDDVTH